MKKAGLICAGFLALATVLAGCGGSSGSAQDEAVEKAMEAAARAQGEDVDVEFNSESGAANIKVHTADGDVELSSGEGAKLPEGIPGDVPIFPDMKISFSQRQSQENAYSVIGVTQKPIKEVAAYYKKEAEAQGWTQESSQEMDMGEMQMHNLVYEKEGRGLNVNIMRDKDGTTVQLITHGG
jgi:predicted small secreted protein